MPALKEALIHLGAAITLAKGFGPFGPHGIAAARYQSGELVWVSIWPDDQSALHVLKNVRLVDSGDYNQDVYQGNTLAASIAPMEPDELAEFHWREWSEPAAQGHKDFAARLLDDYFFFQP